MAYSSSNPKPLPSQDLLLRLLRHEPNTGKLYWRTRTPDLFDKNKQSAQHNCNSWNSRHAGKEAFISFNTGGYRTGCILSTPYLATRIIWKMIYGVDPIQIDHKNGIRTDDRIMNLRSVSHKENGKNKKTPNNNTSGTIGVFWVKSNRKWRVQIKVDGNRIHIGYFTNKDRAIKSRKSAELKYKFHKNHGRNI